MKKQFSLSLFHFFLFSLFFAMSACVKSPKKIKVTGCALDATTCEPIASAHLIIANYSATGNGYGIEQLDETYTNVDGYYHFEINNSSGSEHHIIGKMDNYFDTDKYENTVPDKSDVDDFNILFTPKGYVNFVLNKVDTSYISISSSYQGLFGNFSLQAVEGWSTRDSVLIEMKGNQINELSMYVAKYNSGGQFYTAVDKHSIYPIAGDTITYLANY